MFANRAAIKENVAAQTVMPQVIAVLPALLPEVVAPDTRTFAWTNVQAPLRTKPLFLLFRSLLL